MPQPSSYLRFLPPALYQDAPTDPDFSVGGFLRIAEKILTGIDDAVQVGDGADNPPGLQAKIANIARLFDPFRTPPDFLAYLASWLSLDLPVDWNEYQKRKVISEIVGIYQRRGSRGSLQQYLEIYTVGDKRPLVFIGEGGQVFRVTPAPNRLAPVEAFVTHQPVLAPQAIVTAPENTMFVADGGLYPFAGAGTWRLDKRGHVFTGQPTSQQRLLPPIFRWFSQRTSGAGNGVVMVPFDVNPAPFPRGVLIEIVAGGVLGTATFHISKDGGNTYGVVQTVPADGHYGPDTDGLKLIFRDGVSPSFVANAHYLANGSLVTDPKLAYINFYVPKSVCVDPTTSHVYIQGFAKNTAGVAGMVQVYPSLHRATAPTFANAEMDTVADPDQLGTLWPQAMLFHQSGRLLILDRGINLDFTGGNLPLPQALVPAPKIIEVTLDTTGAKFMSKENHPLSTVLDPASFCQLSNGDLIIGDARESDKPTPADLVRVSPSNSWSETRLLSGLPADQNPLVAPVGVVPVDDHHFYVLDAGLKPYEPFLELCIRNADPNVETSPFEPSKDEFNPFLRLVANYPAVYSVDLSGATPVIKQVSETGRLTRPTGMTMMNGDLYIADQGVGLLWYLTVPELLTFDVRQPGIFTVEVNFTKERPTTQGDRRAILDVIEKILKQEKPAHTQLLLIGFT